MNKNVKLVWSDDPKDKAKMSPAQSPAGARPVQQWVAVFRLEKGGRGGKTVTVIDQLPKQDDFLRALCKELKSKCGSGGTYSSDGKYGVIEIQGDQRVAIKALFTKQGIRYKGM